jgi:hypothetical protein
MDSYWQGHSEYSEEGVISGISVLDKIWGSIDILETFLGSIRLRHVSCSACRPIGCYYEWAV